jgi:hypothetical protein
VIELGQPVLVRGIEQLEQDRLAGLEVPEHVRLSQADATAQLIQGDLGHRHLGQHRGCRAEDRLPAALTLLFAARTLEDGHLHMLQTTGTLCTDRWSARLRK